MKLLTYKLNNETQIGVILSGDSDIYPLKALGFEIDTMNDFIISGSIEKLKEIASCSDNFKEIPTISLSDVELCAPIPSPMQDVICLGINYAEHAEESAKYKKEFSLLGRDYATYFSKRVLRAVDPGKPIDSHSDFVEKLDYEVELAVVIGKDVYKATPENAYDHILGYTILNDMSARDLQTRHNQWYFGKSLDDFTPIGPWIVTEDEFTRPPEIKLSSHINGELRQNSSTDLLLHDISEVICELSQGMTLTAGTIIATGTPSGVGLGFNPPKFVKPGDVVTCTIEGIGVLENPIK